MQKRNQSSSPPLTAEPLAVYDFRPGNDEPPHLTPIDVAKSLIQRKELTNIDATHRHGLVHVGAWLNVMDSSRRVLVLKRGSDLVTCPNSWGLVGEHALGLETPLETARRGIREELGSDILKHVSFIKPLTSKPLYYIRDYGKANGNRIDRQVTYLWQVQLDVKGGDLILDLDKEVADFAWMAIADVQEWLRQGRNQWEKEGQVRSKLCHHTIVSLWEKVMNALKPQ